MARNTSSSSTGKTSNPWLLSFKQSGKAELKLFCFPYAGGHSLRYRTWADGLPLAVEVCPVQLPGRGSRLSEPAYTNMANLVDAMYDSVFSYISGPFALFGHSMGAVIAFEFARLLRKRHNLLPSHLFVSGRQAPQLQERDPQTYDLPEPEFIEDLKRLNGTPAEVFEHPELLQLMLPLLRADFELIQTYSCTEEPPLDCPITAVGGLEDTEVPFEKLQPWGEQTTAAFSLKMLPGDHFFLHSSKDLLLRIISQTLRLRA